MNYKLLQKLRVECIPGIAGKYLSILSDALTPIVHTDFGKFYCHGYLPYWRVETFKTKEPLLNNYLAESRESVVWDIGANVGMYSIYAASLGKRVYAFEPDPSNYYLLCKNILLNGMQDKITAYPFALGRYYGIGSLKTDCECGASNTLGFSGTGLVVPVLAPSMVKTLFNPEPPEFLKIDIDGGELVVLKSIFDAGLGKDITFASVEYNDDPEIDQYMSGKGFLITSKDKTNHYYRRVCG